MPGTVTAPADPEDHNPYEAAPARRSRNNLVATELRDITKGT